LTFKGLKFCDLCRGVCGWSFVAVTVDGWWMLWRA